VTDRHPPRRGRLLAALAALAVAVPTQGLAPNTILVSRIEQDWEIVVNNPDALRGAPQVVLHVRPWPGSSYLCLFLLNYQDHPSFASGGTQLQIWRNDTLRAAAAYGTGILESPPDETIKFTLYLEQTNGLLKFGFKALTSKTWGDKDTLGVSTARSMNDLSSYATSDTVANSVILLAPERVLSAKVLEVRQYDGAGTVVATESQVPVFTTQ
jgi:hypothetical protein